MRREVAAPEWNEQLSFVELFPPLTRSLRLQLRDDAPLVDVALATHVLDLRQISHPGRAGERMWPTLAGLRLRWVPPALHSKPHPRDPALLGKSAPLLKTNCAPNWPLPSELHLSPHTSPTLALAPLTES